MSTIDFLRTIRRKVMWLAAIAFAIALIWVLGASSTEVELAWRIGFVVFTLVLIVTAYFAQEAFVAHRLWLFAFLLLVVAPAFVGTYRLFTYALFGMSLPNTVMGFLSIIFPIGGSTYAGAFYAACFAVFVVAVAALAIAHRKGQ